MGETSKDSSYSWPRGRSRLLVVATLLTTQASLLAYSATRHTPTSLEPAFLASGISHWLTGRFELYRVTPPLVRMVAAIPVLAVGCKTDWSHYYDGPGSRAEFDVGADFVAANDPRFMQLFVYARWACIPFSLVGAFFAQQWARELYGNAAALMTLTLYVFEPNLLAHGELITSDGACTALTILSGYTFWKWLKNPTWARSILAGSVLGLAQLSKLSCLILVGIWPVLWLAWCLLENRGSKEIQLRNPSAGPGRKVLHAYSCVHRRCCCIFSGPPISQLIVLLLIALYVLNLGYGFDAVGAPLGDLEFVSSLLSGGEGLGVPGNRFRDQLIGRLPLPLPKQYVLGFDSQSKDFEHFPQDSYLRGRWKHGGWWHYYLYGLWVKVPCGVWGLLLLTLLFRFMRKFTVAAAQDEMILLTPAIILFVAVSRQTEFNVHFRYILPSLGMFLVFLGQLLTFDGLLIKVAAKFCITWTVVSVLVVYPHHLAYFNEFVGGPRNGYRHILGSSLNWGQDLLLIHEWMQANQIRKDEVLMRSRFAYPASSLVSDIRARSSSIRWIAVPVEEVFAQESPWANRLVEPSTRMFGFSFYVFAVNRGNRNEEKMLRYMF